MTLKKISRTYAEKPKTDTLLFSECPTLICNPEDETELSVFSMPTEMFTVDESAPAPLAPTGKKDAPRSSKAPENESYRVTHEIGAGGYGSIWYGVQNTLKRRVAMKSLKADDSTSPQFDKLSRLFRQEAITTAYLQHPNIVPVYDLVTDKINRPIVVMKLVEGRQWHRVLTEDFDTKTPLEFLEIHLPVLISVAQAVAFAHSKGIIHRDLKPSQVMIGNFGEVQLMDWGLAMAARDNDDQIYCDPAIIVDAHSPLIRPIMPAGTPGYMAPEQTLRDINKLGPWTDVYLLGAILYELLTGYRPHIADAKEDPMALARANKIEKPESCNNERDIPAQLSQLAMKCMSTKPQNRLESASDFAQQLKDYLIRAGRRGESMALVTDVANSVIHDEHTYANLQTSLEKLDRALAHWPDNHMAPYLRSQVLATFARKALENHDLKLARFQMDRMENAFDRENIARDLRAAEEEFDSSARREAGAKQQALAERERAEALISFLLDDLHNELRTVGRADLVHKVASEALQFFDSLTDSTISQQSQYNRCVAYLQIANVLSEQGRRSEAESAYNRAIDLAKALTKDKPQNSEWKQLYANCEEALGRLYYTMGRLEASIDKIHATLKVRQELLSHSKKPNEARYLHVSTVQNLALSYWRNQQLDHATHYIDEAVETARKLVKNQPSNADFQSILAVSLGTKSNILRDRGDLKKAIDVTYESLTIRIALYEQFPGNAERVEEMMWIRANLGLLQMMNGNHEDAIENLRQDMSQRRRLYEEDTTNVVRCMGLTFQLSLLAEANFNLGKVDETERFLTECLLYSRNLNKADSSNPTVISRFALHLVQMAELQATRNQWKDAISLSTQALERARYSYWLSPNNSGVIGPMLFALSIETRLARRNNDQRKTEHLMDEVQSVMPYLYENGHRMDLVNLQARIDLLTASPAEAHAIGDRLESLRRLDPYVKGWIGEITMGIAG